MCGAGPVTPGRHGCCYPRCTPTSVCTSRDSRLIWTMRVPCGTPCPWTRWTAAQDSEYADSDHVRHQAIIGLGFGQAQRAVRSLCAAPGFNTQPDRSGYDDAMLETNGTMRGLAVSRARTCPDVASTPPKVGHVQLVLPPVIGFRAAPTRHFQSEGPFSRRWCRSRGRSAAPRLHVDPPARR
jgi:hypothetical protein